MSLFVRAKFEKFVLGLPATTIVHQWGDSSVAKVGGKVFALTGLSVDGPGITFKVSEMTFDMLTELEGVGQAPYFAKRQWVAVERHTEVSQSDLRAYVEQSHRMIVAKLTRKLRAELGLADLPDPATL